ncbi:DinB family protein [Haloglycomyces albus]|uniref:DinB family protein n=1 Tax=Haloglycomyces albus TaxID=526067 RepID=UPI00046D8C10|nr:DinB family protein [Haloglycomyces albus]
MTWTAPEIDQPNVFSGDLGERALLENYLDYFRAELLKKCTGLDPDQLKQRNVDPSTISLLGLVRHMADVEKWWFCVLLDQQDLAAQKTFTQEEDFDADFNDLDGLPAEDVWKLFDKAVEQARDSAAKYDLDKDVRTTIATVNLRWVYIHMIEEYARHCGHADFLRERIDGATSS